jgi:3-deoxy-D-manno-octulosonic-acid transferase
MKEDYSENSTDDLPEPFWPYRLLYKIIVSGYFSAIRLSSLWNHKAKKWIQGRQGLFPRLRNDLLALDGKREIIWMHCASAGEFEAGRIVLQNIRSSIPEKKILLTFFSSSGYELHKGNTSADYVSYLPADSENNARLFLEVVNPSLALFIQYEFWYYILHELKSRKIPTLLLSAQFRPGQPFFKSYGLLHRYMLSCFDTVLVNDVASFKLLNSIGVRHIEVTGSTRVDRVIEIKENCAEVPLVSRFAAGSKVLICGSTWPKDEKIILQLYQNEHFVQWKFILAPHEVHETRIQALLRKCPLEAMRYSDLQTRQTMNSHKRLLIIDNIGMLAALYQYGTIAYIGGGFSAGIHSILEPAAFGLPVCFGPKHQQFSEAQEMIATGAAFEISDAESLGKIILSLEGRAYQDSSFAVNAFMKRNRNATEMVMQRIKNSLLKTATL